MKQQEKIAGICLFKNAHAFIDNTALFQLQKKLLQTNIGNNKIPAVYAKKVSLSIKKECITIKQSN